MYLFMRHKANFSTCGFRFSSFLDYIRILVGNPGSNRLPFTSKRPLSGNIAGVTRGTFTRNRNRENRKYFYEIIVIIIRT